MIVLQVIGAKGVAARGGGRKVGARGGRRDAEEDGQSGRGAANSKLLQILVDLPSGDGARLERGQTAFKAGERVGIHAFCVVTSFSPRYPAKGKNLLNFS